MKKNLLAASLALALGSLSGAASAALEVNTNGIGQINVLPYYSVQDSYNTLMTITNTDTVNGKVVKVRFRAAEWSDDALDFQIFLSPADVWTGAFGMVDGQLVLKTSDNSCSLPASLDGQQFTTIRVEGGDVNRLKEGYVEIINVADIPQRLNGSTTTSDTINPLYTATKHVNGVAPCGTVVTGLLENSTRDRLSTVASNISAEDALLPGSQGSWLVEPTGGLTSSATVIAVQDSKAFTVPGVAIYSDDGSDFSEVQYFRQSNATIFTGGVVADDTALADLTSDRLFYTTAGAGYPTYQFDLPDLSTPFDGGTADDWRDAIAVKLQKGSVATDYVIASSIQASTDVVLSQPVRRYFYEYDDVVAAPGFNPVAGVDYNRTIRSVNYLVTGQAATPYQDLTVSNRVQVGAPTFWDREEQTFVSEDDIVVSPQEPGESAKYFLEGEVSVVSIKKRGAADAPTEAIGARLTDVDWSFSQNYTAGWAALSTTAVTGAAVSIPSASKALPVVGFTAINIFNSGAGANGTNYGQVLPLRVLD